MPNTALLSARFQSIALARINTRDETFRITTREDIDELSASIQSDGLITPPLLIEKDADFSIISGFRRVAACQRLNWREIAARTLKPGIKTLDCLRLAIADNALQRPLNLIETSRCLQKLATCVRGNRRLAEAASSLGLPSNPSIIGKIQNLCLLPQAIQGSILAGTISLPTARELEHMPAASALFFARLFDQLKIGLNKQKEIITQVNEIARREGLTAQEVMEDDAIKLMLEDGNLDRGQKTLKLRSLLRQRRYPRIVAAEHTFETHRRELKLGEDINLIPPRDFEATTYCLNLTFRDLERLKALRKKLDKIIQHPALKSILDCKR